MSSVSPTEVAQTELTEAVDKERVNDGNVQVRAQERGQLVGPLCVSDQQLDIVDSSLTQWANVGTRTPAVDEELSASVH